jgi:hypothetical protein
MNSSAITRSSSASAQSMCHSLDMAAHKVNEANQKQAVEDDLKGEVFEEAEPTLG